jgi:hypothetical protein
MVDADARSMTNKKVADVLDTEVASAAEKVYQGLGWTR